MAVMIGGVLLLQSRFYAIAARYDGHLAGALIGAGLGTTVVAPALAGFSAVRFWLRRHLRCPQCRSFLSPDCSMPLVIERARCIRCGEVVGDGTGKPEDG